MSILCPSSPCKEWAILLGIVLADGSVAYASNHIVVDAGFVQNATRDPFPLQFSLRPGRLPAMDRVPLRRHRRGHDNDTGSRLRSRPDVAARLLHPPGLPLVPAERRGGLRCL